MNEKTHEEEFYSLVAKAAGIHALTWCVKARTSILTIEILRLRCWSCSEFVLNGGICDPL